jgi:YbgC/YbaW family acyl-CoA thioester hydrolase
VAIGEFTYRRRVQYRDTDASGIAHFSAFFVFCEEAEHAMWRSVGLTVEARQSDIGWPRLSASFEFLRALRFEDEIDVQIRLVGKTSKTFRYQAVIYHEGRIAAAGAMTTICVRKRPGEPLRAIDIPEAVADCFTVVPAVEISARPPTPDP